jgi:hypothetical protein
VIQSALPALVIQSALPAPVIQSDLLVLLTLAVLAVLVVLVVLVALVQALADIWEWDNRVSAVDNNHHSMDRMTYLFLHIIKKSALRDYH